MIYSSIAQVLNTCFVQFIGNQISTEQNLLTYQKETTLSMLSVLLDTANSSHAGKYYSLILKQPNTTHPKGKTPNTYHNLFWPGSGTVTILLTQWIYRSHPVIKNPVVRVSLNIYAIVQHE